jgi:hypothetical protein
VNGSKEGFSEDHFPEAKGQDTALQKIAVWQETSLL